MNDLLLELLKLKDEKVKIINKIGDVEYKIKRKLCDNLNVDLLDINVKKLIRFVDGRK